MQGSSLISHHSSLISYNPHFQHLFDECKDLLQTVGLEITAQTFMSIRSAEFHMIELR